LNHRPPRLGPAITLAVLTMALPCGARGTPADEAAPGSAAGVWEELPRQRAGPLSLDGSSWFVPPSAAYLAVEVAGDETPTVWRVEIDADGSPSAQVELKLDGPQGGRWTTWIPPSPSAPHAVVADGAVRAFTFLDL
jgi:hypothetical protein